MADNLGQRRRKVIGIAGSLRSGSLNAALLHAAGACVRSPWVFGQASIRDIPLYNQDIEDAGIPEAVARFKDELAAADAIVIASPEYNNGIPGVVKNAFDWASRPQPDIARVFAGKPVAVIGASPGPYGTVLAQHEFQGLFRILRMTPWHGERFLLPTAHSRFDAAGALTEDMTRQRLESFMTGFLDFSARVAPNA